MGRKGLDLVLRAYQEEFSPEEDVSLVLKVAYRGFDSEVWSNVEDITKRRPGTCTQSICDEFSVHVWVAVLYCLTLLSCSSVSRYLRCVFPPVSLRFARCCLPEIACTSS